MTASRARSRAPAAVIDIGTNSVKLLVARGDGTAVHPIHFERVTTRLGTGLAGSGRISDAAASRTARAVAAMAKSARGHGVSQLAAVGTYALRTASNGPAVARQIAHASGVEPRILSGRDEAQYAFDAARAVLTRTRPVTFVLDVGGGSAQFVVARGNRILSARSYPIGALRLTEKHIHTDPIDPAEYARMLRDMTRTVERAVAPHLALAPRAALIAVGGSATTALAMAHGGRAMRARSGTITVSGLRALEQRCRAASTATRRRMPGLPADRADIIPAGLAVVLAFARAARKRVVHVSGGGIREGVVLAMLRGTW